MSPKNLLDKIEIVSPCSADWDAMTGNDQIRFCEHCDREVNDLSMITPKQIKKLILRSHGRFCVRYFPGQPASLTTTVIPEKLHQIGRRVSRLAAGAFTATLTLTGAIAQTPQPSAAFHREVAINRSTAQESGATSGVITGHITDPTGALVVDASITLVNSETKLSLATISNHEGQYKFDLLPPGSYSLTAVAPGFVKSEVKDISLVPNAQQQVDSSLQVDGLIVAVVEVRAVVEVEQQVTGGVIIASPAEPIVKAANENDLPAVRNAILTTRDVNIRDKNTDMTALEQALHHGNREMVQVLVGAGANVNTRDSSKQTPLMQLGEDGSGDLVWDLVSAGAKVNARDEDGNTSLTQAADRENAKVVKALLDAGAKVDARNNKGETALIIAAAGGYVENIRALILGGADINARDHDGKTALTQAKENGHSEVVTLLASYGAQE